MFEMGKDYTRGYIHTICGGNKQSFLPVHRGKVVAACLRPDLNPQAPDVIICNSGAAARAAGRTLAKQDGSIPVFIEQTTDRLRYVGNFAVTESLTIPADCDPYAKDTKFTPRQISRVIKLRRG
ncbi:hypothetical protein [Pararobbsia alpina]|uniref:DUF6697 domain-containing protein n=1 Tax=Pararobbsia alpina TaxID=621374 RepID=A0A6S7BD17_9BURK|nr:hypothetical protein [Pararobbsia alpina]CAB3796112.1 hypothetical protein LMG28138_04013 [Pararobbsia alpina]